MPDLRCASRPLRPPRRALGVVLAATLATVLMGCEPQAAGAREGVEVGSQSRFAKLVPADSVEGAAQQQYVQMLTQARQQNALLPDQHPQVIRLRNIARRIVPFTTEWNPRARQWTWQVNVVHAKQLNAFCMPGGKIVFYTGILDQLKLTDDEVAMIMGHEIAHALREHARERMGKSMATNLGAGILSSLLGLGSAGNQVLGMGNQLLNLKFSRGDETEADLVGMELAARAGYNPHAGVSLWRKMAEAAKGAPPEFMSTHPSDDTRIQQIEANLPKVMPLYERAPKPPRL